jgi:hypothetical protein
MQDMKLKVSLGSLLVVFMVLITMASRTTTTTGTGFTTSQVGTPPAGCPAPPVGGNNLCGAEQLTAALITLISQPLSGLGSGGITSLTSLLQNLQNQLAMASGGPATPATCHLVNAIVRRLRPAQTPVGDQILADIDSIRADTGCP